MWGKASVVALGVLISVSVLTTPVQSDFSGAITDKFAEELISTPMQEGWKDIYNFVVHKKGAQFLRTLRYMAGNKETKDLAGFVMEKLRVGVFEGRANPNVWGRLTKEFWYILTEWWNTSPEDPKSTLDTGIWHSLVLLHRDFLANSMKGSDKLQKLNEILFDPELVQVSDWAKEWLLKQKEQKDANTKKTESKEKTTESKEKTTESKEKTTESKEKTTESNEKTTESNENSAASDGNAAESDGNAAESDGNAAESGENATESDKKGTE